MNPSSSAPADPQPDWARLLPREAFHEIILILRAALPPPVSDDPAGRARRDRAAMAAVAALQPENAAEGRLAAQFVAADAYAMDCLRLAQERRREPEVARRCAAQATSMMREAKSALRLLLRLQAARHAVADDAAAASRAAWAEHGAVRMMEEALSAAASVRPTAPPSVPATASGGERTEVAPGHGWKFRQTSSDATHLRKTRRETEPRPWPQPVLAAS